MNAETALDKSISNNKRLWEIIEEIDKLAKEGKTKSDWIECDDHCVSLLKHLGYKLSVYQGTRKTEVRVSW